MKKEVLILNFTGVYNEENFYQNYPQKIIDFTDLEGCRMILSEQAKEKILKRISQERVDGIHFIDSGDYHYLTKLFIDQIQKDFILIVFDHHTDAQDDWFKDQLTCGNWINHIENSHLKKIILIGPDALSNQYYTDIPEKKMERADSFQQSKLLLSDLPVYISIDKDVLSKEEIDTNWDQGNMKKDSLLKAIDKIFQEDQVIGIDICGECGSEMQYLQEIIQDNQLNLEILEELENEKS